MRNAYFTVEAALILPIVFSIVLMSVYLLIFQYDRCLLDQDIGKLTLYAEELSLSNTNAAVRELEKRLKKLGDDRYILWEIQQLQIFLDKGVVTISGKGRLLIPTPEWLLIKNQELFTAEVTRKVTLSSITDYIRLYKRVMK